MRVIIIGGSGATGSALIREMLSSPDITDVLAWGRKELKLKHEKLRSEIVDFEHLENYPKGIEADYAVSCLGTTLGQAGSLDAQVKIDYEYQVKFATLCAKNAVPAYMVISTVRANAKSRVFYTRMKGNLEAAIEQLSFRKIAFLQPALLIRPGSKRFIEKNSIRLVRFFNQLGLLLKYRPVEVETLGKAMLKAVINGADGVTRYSVKEIFDLAKG